MQGCNPPHHPRALSHVLHAGEDPEPGGTVAQKYVVADHTFSMYDSPRGAGTSIRRRRPRTTSPVICPIRFRANRNPTAGAARRTRSPRGSIPQRTRIRCSRRAFRRDPACSIPRSTRTAGRSGRRTVKWVPTIFDRLDAKHLRWKLYVSALAWAICPNFAECLFGPQRNHMVSPTSILGDAKNGQASRVLDLAARRPGCGNRPAQRSFDAAR